MAELKPFVVKFDGKEVTQTLKQIGQEISSAKKEQDKFAVGTKEWIEASKRLDTVRDKYQSVKEAANQYNASLKNLDLSKFGEAGGILQRVKAQFSDLNSGFGSAVSGLGSVKVAIAGTGIGLLLIAFTALITYFKKTDEGAMKLDGIMRALGAVIDILTNIVINFGKILVDAFTNPWDTIKKVVFAALENIKNRVTAFLVIWEGIKNGDFSKITDGAIQAGTGIENATAKAKGLVESTKKVGDEMARAAKEAMDLAETLDAIDDKRRDTELATAQNEKVIARLLLQSKNRTTSDRERIALLKEASRIEVENHTMQLSLNADNIRATEIELAAKIRAANTEVDLRKKTNAQLIELAKNDGLKKGTLSDEDLDKYNQVLIAKEGLDQKSIELQEKITNRMDALEQRAAEKRAKATQKRIQEEEKARQKLKEIQDAELAAFQKIQDLEVSIIQDTDKQKSEVLKLAASREIEAVQKSKASTELKAGLILAIENKLSSDLAKVQTDSAKAQKELADKTAKEDLELRKRQAQAKVDLEVSLAQAALNRANKSGDDVAQAAARQALLNAQIEAIKTRAQFEIESTQATEDEKNLIITNSENQINALREQSAVADRQRNAQTAQSIVNGFQTGLSTLADFGALQSQNELKRAERDKNNRLRALDDEFKKGKIGKEAYEKSKADIELGFDTQSRNIKRKQAEDQKKWNIAQAIMQAAVAFIAASATPLGPFSPAAIATGIVGALSIAKVIATPLPEYAKGGVLNGPSHAQGGMKVIGSNGRPVAELEGGEPILSRATYRNNPDLVNLLLDSSMNRGGSKVYVDPVLLRSYRYETGGILPGGSPASAASSGGSQSVDPIVQEISLLREQLARQHQESIETIRNLDTVLKSYVVIGDVADALNQLRSIKREANGTPSDGSTSDGSPVILEANLF